MLLSTNNTGMDIQINPIPVTVLTGVSVDLNYYVFACEEGPTLTTFQQNCNLGYKLLK